jgi:hypothetical protein
MTSTTTCLPKEEGCLRKRAMACSQPAKNRNPKLPRLRLHKGRCRWEGSCHQRLIVKVEQQISAVAVCLDLAENEAEVDEGDVFRPTPLDSQNGWR